MSEPVPLSLLLVSLAEPQIFQQLEDFFDRVKPKLIRTRHGCSQLKDDCICNHAKRFHYIEDENGESVYCCGLCQVRLESRWSAAGDTANLNALVSKLRSDLTRLETEFQHTRGIMYEISKEWDGRRR